MEVCTKCGNSNKITVEYEVKGKLVFSNRPIDNVEQFIKIDESFFIRDKVKQEHLIYTCDVCGYKMATKCKDSK